jgi:hypothetical protein
MLQAMVAMANDLNRRGKIIGNHRGTGIRNSQLLETSISDVCGDDGVLILGSSTQPVSPVRGALTEFSIVKHGVPELRPEDVLGLQIYRYHPLVIVSALLPQTILEPVVGENVNWITRSTDSQLIPIFNKKLGALLTQLVDIGGLIRFSGDQFIRRSVFLNSPGK